MRAVTGVRGRSPPPFEPDVRRDGAKDEGGEDDRTTIQRAAGGNEWVKGGREREIGGFAGMEAGR